MPRAVAEIKAFHQAPALSTPYYGIVGNVKTRAREGAGILNVGRVALPPALLTVVTITDLGDAMAVEEGRAYLTKARESLASA